MQNVRDAAARFVGNWMDQRTTKKAKAKNMAREQREAETRERWTSRIPSQQSTNEACLAAREVPISTQSGSKFFTMLPLELRQTIYSLALGGERLKLELVDDPKRATFTISGNAEGLLSFPKTCRLAYAESIESIYKYNTFSTNNLACILFLPCFVTPPLFNAIQSLELRYPVHLLYMQTFPPKLPPGDEATYEETWAVLSGMRGLKSLEVHLSSYTAYMDAEIEKKLFHPMTKCQGVETFRVRVDWGVPPNESRETRWPFQVEWASSHGQELLI